MTATAHSDWMATALTLACHGEGLTRPNPPVGAVVVRAGRIVGKGWHRRAGGPHAEVYALRQAGPQAQGATLYVTLEPCSTRGRTAPCTDAIVAAGIRQVVWSVDDPNPAHAGRASHLLRRHGITVVRGVNAPEGHALIAPFACLQRTGRPMVTLKLGLTLDGKIADRRGQSRWITGPAAREQVQTLRRRVDAIWVGGGTVRADNPSLWPRPAKGRTPWRIVQDGAGHTSHRAHVFTDTHATRTCIALDRRSTARQRQAFTRHGACVITVPQNPVRAVQRVCAQLGEWGALHILCEGGGELADALLRARCVDELWLFVAPKLMGGRDSIPAIGGRGRLMNDLENWEFVEPKRVGIDCLLRARPRTNQR